MESTSTSPSVSPVKWELVPSKSYVDNAVSTGVKSVVNFKGATSTAAGTAGLVPAPAKGTQTNYYLSADGTWKKVQQRTKKEVIDILHFVMDVFIAGDVSPNEVKRAYLENYSTGVSDVSDLLKFAYDQESLLFFSLGIAT